MDLATGLFYDANTMSSNNNNSNNSNNPIKSSSSTTPDWCDLVQKFIEHGYDTSLIGEKAQDHPLLLSERSYNPPAIRQMVTECLFEELQVPAAFLAKDAEFEAEKKKLLDRTK